MSKQVKISTIKSNVKVTSTPTKKQTSLIPTEDRNLVAKKTAKIIDTIIDTIIESDDTIDIEKFELTHNAHIKEEIKLKKSSRSLTAASTCIQGKQAKVTRDNPHLSPAINSTQYIIQLHVTLSTQNLKITWLDGKIENFLCSPNPSKTPKGNFIVGNKCGAKHTNFKKDGMAWFTALAKYGMAYGFHNSQRVGIGVVSHGCVRVPCELAKKINQHSWSGKTKIKIVS